MANATQTTVASTIPNVLLENKILGPVAQDLLEGIEKIKAYNEKYVKSDDGPSIHKQVRHAKDLATKEDAPKSVKDLVAQYEAALTTVNKARQALAEYGAKDLGVAVAAAEPDEAETDQLKEARKELVAVAETFALMADMVPDIKDVVVNWLADNPIPGVGRKSFTDVTSTSTSAPKYRLTISRDDGKEWNGITKAVQDLGKDGPTADEFRAAYETQNVVNGTQLEAEKRQTVEFKHGEHTYTVTPK